MGTDDPLIEALRRRVNATGQSPKPVARASELATVEQALGLALPSFYRRMLLEIGNGNFGPGPLYGMPPNGYFDDDLRRPGIASVVDVYRRDRASTERRPARALIYLCNWGAGKWSHLDCATDAGAVITSEWLAAHGTEPEGLHHWRTSPSLAEWMQEWASGTATWPDLTVDVLGWQTRKNPFTGLPRQYPITQPRGPRVDLSDRE